MFWLVLGCNPATISPPDLSTPEADTASVGGVEEVSVSGLQSDTAEQEDTGEADFFLPQLNGPLKEVVESGLNVLVIVADDIGVESSACYEGVIDAERAPQPTIEGLCADGLTFTDTWSYPLCSPTRAAMMTGRYGWRTGIGRALDEETAPLSPEEVTLPDLVDSDDALIGKWHLTGRMNPHHPQSLGWSYYSGTLHGGVEDYHSYDKVFNGSIELEEDYLTTEVVDDALSWLEGQGDDPWLMWVAFNAPHTPRHLAPEHLHTRTDIDELEEEELDLAYFQSMIEAMDTEMGRLLDGVDRDKTVVIYVGDNGSENAVNQGVYPDSHGKSSLFQGGVHVPLIINGPGIPAGEVDAMVHVVDLFSTVLDLTNSEPPEGVELDSISLLPYLADPDTEPLRDMMYTEIFGSRVSSLVAGRAVRTKTHKLIRLRSGHEQLYDLQNDPTEINDLINSEELSATTHAEHIKLRAYMDEMSLRID